MQTPFLPETKFSTVLTKRIYPPKQMVDVLKEIIKFYYHCSLCDFIVLPVVITPQI